MKKLIATFALCLFAAGASRGQNYSDMLYRDWAGLRAFAQVNRNLTVEPEMRVRFRQDVIELHPRVVAILAGTNDIAMNNGYIALENTFQNIVSMCELAKFNGSRVVLCSVLPCDRVSWRPEIKPAAAVAELNTMLRQYAAEHKIPYVDYHAAFDNGSGGLDARFSQDGCHPTLYGYTLMEPMVVEGINKALRTKQARYTTPTPTD